jgi:hypothetical protein
MPYTNAGFTGNDGTESTGWDIVEVQHFKDIEDTVVADAIGQVKDTQGHKHAKLYNSSKASVADATDGSLKVSRGLTLAGMKVSTLVGGSGFDADGVDCLQYSGYSWRPPNGVAAGNLTVTPSNAQEGSILFVANYDACVGYALVVAGFIFDDSVNHLMFGILMYENGQWHRFGNGEIV